MTTTETKTPAWLLERLALGELDAAEADRLRARLAAEGRSLDDELAALRRSNEEILASRPKEMMAAAIRRRAEGAAPAAARRGRFNLMVAPLALVGTLGIALLVARGRNNAGTGAGTDINVTPGAPRASDFVRDENLTIKGDGSHAALLVYRQRPARRREDSGVERLSDGARAATGDLLQLAYAASGRAAQAYGVLVSIDGAGRVTQHLPEEGARSALPLRAEGEIRLPSSYQLDDAPGFERFVLITAPQPFDVGVALAAARALASQPGSARTAPLALAPAFQQTSVLLRKNERGTP